MLIWLLPILLPTQYIYVVCVCVFHHVWLSLVLPKWLPLLETGMELFLSKCKINSVNRKGTNIMRTEWETNNKRLKMTFKTTNFNLASRI
jgi:hypothetical protein